MKIAGETSLSASTTIIPMLYRFEALSYLGIFVKYKGDNPTQDDIQMMLSVLGHWETLGDENSEEKLCEK